MKKSEGYDLEAIGQRMKLVRARLRRTQASMAHDLGVSLSHYSKLEVGIGGMSHGLAYTYCTTFGVNMDWFLYGTGEEPENLIAPDERATLQEAQKNALTDDKLEKIVELAYQSHLVKIADQFANATHIPRSRAIALMIKESLANEDKQ